MKDIMMNSQKHLNFKTLKIIFSSFIFFPLLGKVYLYEFFSLSKLKSIFDNRKRNLLILTFLICFYCLFLDSFNFSEEAINWFGTFILVLLAFNYFTEIHYNYLLKDLEFYLLGFSFSLFLINDSFYFSTSNDYTLKLFGCFCYYFIFKSFHSKYYFIFIILSVISLTILADRLTSLCYLFSLFLFFYKSFNAGKVIRLVFVFTLLFTVFNNYSLTEQLKTKNDLSVSSEYNSNFFLNYILSSRTDIIPMLQGISLNPIIGYGPDGFDRALQTSLLEYNDNYGYSEARDQMIYDRGIVLHSTLLGHWVRFGIIGLIYSCFFIYYPILLLKKVTKHPPFIIFCSLILIVSIFFESGRNRFHLVLFTSLIFNYYHNLFFNKRFQTKDFDE